MLLEQITLENFGIYKDQNVFDFTSTQEKPIILCGGMNGGGKTTLFDSVMLCLYGQNSFDKRINRKDYEKFLGRKIHKNDENLRKINKMHSRGGDLKKCTQKS